MSTPRNPTHSFMNTSRVVYHPKQSSWDRVRRTLERGVVIIITLWNRWCWFITVANALLMLIAMLAYLGYTLPSPDLSDKIIVVKMPGESDYEAAATKEFKEYQLQVIAITQELGAQRKALQSVQGDLGSLDATVKKFSYQIENIQTDVSEVQTLVEKWQLAKSSDNNWNVSSKVNKLDNVVKQFAEQLKGLESHVEEVDKDLKAVADLGHRLPDESIPLHNLASRKSGAYVVADLSSPQIVQGPLLHQLYSIVWTPLNYQWPVTDRSSIVSGDAYCFNGSSGILTIALSAHSPVSSVFYEHDFWTTDVPISAPKQYIVKACLDDQCQNVAEIGKCYYSAERKKVSQMCKMPAPSAPTERVQFHFQSNHGQQYTCIYSIRVF